MLVRDVAHILESWAPRPIAWERDNVGLQVGDHRKRVRKILVALDVNPYVVREAKSRNVDLVISHHPLLFHPLRSVAKDDRRGSIIFDLIRNNVAVYAMHTNYDFARRGVSFALAEKLGLEKVSVLQPLRDALRKVAVFVPPDHAEGVAEAMAEAGAGAIGAYDSCSFRIEGVGTFRGGKGAKPFVGKPGTLERVKEIRVEMIVPQWRVGDVVAAMRRVHPYEEVAYDVYALDNDHADYGAGAVGSVPKETTLKRFLATVRERLKLPSVRFAGDLRGRIKTVAVCGGSGSDLLDEAIRRHADAFVTADVRYHTFESAAGSIALIDGGHFETEEPSLDHLVRFLHASIKQRKEEIQVFKTSIITNPVSYA